MPIKGLTDRRRMPRVGKIHLGEKRMNQSGREYPVATEYFVVPPEVAAVVGDQPTELSIIFPSDDPEAVLPTYLKAYSNARGLVCRGDGETARRLVDADAAHVDPDTGEMALPIANRDTARAEWHESIPCPGQACTYYTGDGQVKLCREVMSLMFVLADVPGLGVWQLDTGSYHGILNLHSAFEFAKAAFGSVIGVPFTLALEPMEVSPAGRKKTVRVLHLRSNRTLRDALASADRTLFPALDAGAMPEPDEARPELLYPEHGFAPEQVEPPPAEARPARTLDEQYAAVRERVESEGHITWDQLEAEVLDDDRDYRPREMWDAYVSWRDGGLVVCSQCAEPLHPMDEGGVCKYCLDLDDA